MSTKCEKVITIPQFTSTCWFNSILMVALYSHRMRQLLLNKIKSMDEGKKTNPLMQVFINVIESKYFEETSLQKDEIISKLQLTPEEIINNPDLVSTKYPLMSAAWFFNKNGLWAICDKGSDQATVTAVTKRVNGGTIGLPDRIKHFNEYYNLLK